MPTFLLLAILTGDAMPELPEVETTCRGIAPHICGKKISKVEVRQPKLRWPVSAELTTLLPGHKIDQVSRRGKYLLLRSAVGTLMIHLGMSGSLRIVNARQPASYHDHVDIVFANGKALRFTDPRRFGCMLWVAGDPMAHKLLKSLGPEPLSENFDDDFLWRRSRNRKVPIKAFIMDSKVVVGVGNIYANEALFMAGINPQRAAGRISRARYQALSAAIRKVLARAITAGGTTLRDFTDSDGQPGYFKQSLHVYGRAQLPCTNCKSLLKEIRMGGRSTVYCVHCQT